MKTADVEHEQRICAASGRLTLKLIEEVVRVMEKAHPKSRIVGPQFRDLLIEHAGKKSGPRGKTEEEKRQIAKGALVARGWRRQLGKDEAAKLAAQQFGLEFYDVYRAAFERKDAWARELMRQP